MANKRRKFNVIHNIKVDGEPFNDVAAVKNSFVHFYENLYQDQPSRLVLDGIAFASISLDGISRSAFTDLGNKKALMVSI